MIKFYYTFLLLFALTSCFAQKTKNISPTIIGKWTIEKIELTIENKKDIQAIEDTSYYVFKPDSTYTLFATDLWGKSKNVGKWLPIGENKVKLYDITLISEVKGVLPTNGLGYEIELKNINKVQVLYISYFDKEINWLHELYYKKQASEQKLH